MKKFIPFLFCVQCGKILRNIAFIEELGHPIGCCEQPTCPNYAIMQMGIGKKK